MSSYSSSIRLYKRMPPAVKRTIGMALRPVPRRVLLGRGFQDKLKFLMGSDTWSLEELEAFQLKRLKALVEHAYRNVPYYHDLFTREGVHPSDVNSLSSLRRIPHLDRETITRRYADLTSSDAAEHLPGKASTSGTSGRPLRFLLDQQNREMEYASVWRSYAWGGLEGLDARMASFRGDFVDDQDGPLWRWDPKLGELSFNTYRLDQGSIGRMLDKLNRYRPQGVRGYPHCLYVFSKAMERSGRNLEFTPILVHTSSEQLPQYMRDTIERAFGTKVLDWYAQSEYVVSIGQCREGRYHQVMETGIMRVEEDAWGQESIIGTGLWNYSMPFINYETGDVAMLDDAECPCGRHHLAVKAIEGRSTDFVIARGKTISGMVVENHYDKNILPHLKGVPDFFRLVQESRDAYTIELFRREGMTEEDTALISTAFRAILGEDAEVKVRFLDSFPGQRKWKLVESRLTSGTIAKLLDEE
ncbi:MAG: phenylacetate--CoA ligase family protein [Methanomassiliicoccus sp.]|nr:phenylacetate--CoA ligase family protein [Methanomassiliicoccus sp.]